MSVSKWAYTPWKCDGHPCPGDCDHCPKAYEDESDKQTDLISRADAIEAVAEEWLSEASAESPYVNDNDIDRYRELAEKLFEDIPSAELPKGDLISRADVLKYPIRLDHYDEENGSREFVYGVESVIEYVESLPSADAEPKWSCTANFVAEQLDRLRNMTDEEKWNFFREFFGMGDAVQGDECDHCVYKWGMKGGDE